MEISVEENTILFGVTGEKDTIKNLHQLADGIWFMKVINIIKTKTDDSPQLIVDGTDIEKRFEIILNYIKNYCTSSTSWSSTNWRKPANKDILKIALILIFLGLGNREIYFHMHQMDKTLLLRLHQLRESCDVKSTGNTSIFDIEKLFPTRPHGPASASGTTTEKRAHTKGAGSGAKKDDSLRGAASVIDATAGGSLPASTIIKKMAMVAKHNRNRFCHTCIQKIIPGQDPK
ncbi:unnamed protein product, partial [Rotaria sordida]